MLKINLSGKKMKMDVDIISTEITKPSSPAIHHLKPFKLSVLDQLSPTTYAPLILFVRLKISIFTCVSMWVSYQLVRVCGLSFYQLVRLFIGDHSWSLSFYPGVIGPFSGSHLLPHSKRLCGRPFLRSLSILS